MKAYFEPEQAFSIGIPQPVFEILIAYKKHVLFLQLCVNVSSLLTLISIISTINVIDKWNILNISILG